MPNWRSVEPRTEDKLPVPDSDPYVPELEEYPSQLRLPPEPEKTAPPAPPEQPLPVPPAVDAEVPAQTRRWLPSRSAMRPARVETFSTSNEFDDSDVPPARVTYNSSEDSADAETPTLTPSPEYHSSSQPRLFRPAGTAKNLIDAMRRKISRPESTR